MIEHPWPHFIIGGAPRSGTTFLATLLAQHPHVFMAQPFIPEPKVFMGSGLTRQDYQERYQHYFSQALPEQLRGEKTSNYFESNRCCQLLAEHVPNTRLIFIVREPVSRAYSNWLWSRQNGLETLSFEEAIRLEGTRTSPLPPSKAHAKPFDYISRGNYGTLARNYYQSFPRDQILFLLYERLQADLDALTGEILSFLNLPSHPGLGLGLGIINNTKDNSSTMDPAIKSALRQKILPEVRMFAEATGISLALWNYEGVA